MSQRWSPKKAAVVAFFAVLVLGLIVSITVMSVTGVLGNDSFNRGQALGAPLGILAGLAAFIAYKVQSKRNPDAL